MGGHHYTPMTGMSRLFCRRPSGSGPMSRRVARRADGQNTGVQGVPVGLLGPLPQHDLLWFPIMAIKCTFIFCCATGDGRCGTAVQTPWNGRVGGSRLARRRPDRSTAMAGVLLPFMSCVYAAVSVHQGECLAGLVFPPRCDQHEAQQMLYCR